MKEIKRMARKLLFGLGAPAGSKGFSYMVEILCDGVVNDKPIVSGSKICAHWACVFGDTCAATERSLRYVKDECLNQYNEKFRSIFGNTTIIGTYDFLEMLRFYLMDEMEGHY
mgnify:CR=1 FL=1